ncbi:MAG: protein kinase [Phycisphaerales bacterium]|nr:protein kinase [Phycisphaerales bacterium]
MTGRLPGLGCGVNTRELAMRVEQWESCKSVFEEALRYEGEQRTAFLQRACDGDAALREVVDALLAGHRSNTNFLEPPTGTGLQPIQVMLREAAADDPKRVGHYRVQERISSGGMARIYRAVRDDREFSQTVAVKLIKRGMDTEAIVQQFQRERQTLANLNHPYIARLIDGGSTENGLPFLVMEYVRGCLIDRYCDEHRLSVDQRLQLFLKVCSAVQYAHQNLVVHRDLKPANILVMSDGTPKLLDFGISKLLIGEGASSPLTTISSSKLMTLRYASPEQVLCKTITTASDTYSLGVILYELLTGRSPYNPDSLSRQGLEQLVCDGVPEKPSAVITAAICSSRATRPDKLRRRLQGDLDNIAMTALQKDPERRYSSVQQLADDIVRHLAGMTVSARPDTLKYRAAKFIRRNIVSVVAAAVIFLSLVGGTSVAVFGLFQARAEADKVKQLNIFLQEIFSMPNPQHRGQGVTVREMLDDAAKRFEHELVGQPEARASLHRTLGVTYLGLGVYRSAEAHLLAALDLRRRHYGEFSLESAEVLCDLGELANTQYNPQRATLLFRESLSLYRHHLGQRHPVVARSLRGLGVASYTRGTGHSLCGRRNDICDQDLYHDAEMSLSEAISILCEHDQEVPALYFMDLGMALQRQKKYSASESAYLEGIQASRRQFGDHSVAEAYIRFEYAQLFEARCEFDAAERMFREALAWQRKLLGSRHPYLALSLNRFADFLCQKLEDYEESEELYLEALDIRDNFADCERFRRNAKKYRRRLCALYAVTGDISSAIEVMQDLAKDVKRPDQRSVMHLTHLGDAYLAVGDYSTADQYYQIAISIVRTAWTPSKKEDVSYAHALLGSSRVLAVREDFDCAEAAVRQSIGILRRLLAEDDPRLADSLLVLGEVLMAQSRYEDAEAVLQECLEIRRNTFADQHSLTTAAQRLHDQCLAVLEKVDFGA